MGWTLDQGPAIRKGTSGRLPDRGTAPPFEFRPGLVLKSSGILRQARSGPGQSGNARMMRRIIRPWSGLCRHVEASDEESGRVYTWYEM